MKKRTFYRALGGIALIVAFALMLFLMRKEYFSVSGYPYNDTKPSICINEIMFENLDSLIDCDGDNSDWIELYNFGSKPVNLLGKSIADHIGENRRWYFPDYEMKPGEYLVIFASGKDKVTSEGEMHTDFFISPSDTITLYDEDNTPIDEVYISENVDLGFSVGRLIKDPMAFAVLSNYSPGKENNARVVTYITKTDDKLSLPVFSRQAGIYDEEFDLVLSCEDEDATIVYTMDGSEPDENSMVYKEPISIRDRSSDPAVIGNIKTTPNYLMNYQWENTYTYKATVVRARTLKNNVLSSSTVTGTYFIDPGTSFDIASLSVDTDEMFDKWSGIYVPGETYYVWKKYNKESTNNVFPPANYMSEEKIKGHIEVLSGDGEMKAESDVEVQIMGAASRSNPAKGLKLTVDEEGGCFDLGLFEVLPTGSPASDEEKTDNSRLKADVTKTDSLFLRAGGSDFYRTMFCDILAQSIVAGSMNVTYQAAQPAVLFINGEYWGIHNLREVYSDDYFYRHYSIDPDNLCLIKLNTDVEPFAPEITAGTAGDLQDYNDLVDYVLSHDLTDPDNYEYVCSQIDVDSFIDYYIAEIYFGNDDWPGNNFRIFRNGLSGTGLVGQKWRPVLFDLDDAFLYPDFNSVEYILKQDYDPAILKNTGLNYDGNRELITALIRNEEFKNRFFSRFDECLDTVFSTENVLEYINKYREIYAPEMEAHFSRWHTVDGWFRNIKNMIKFTYSEKDLYTVESWNRKVEQMQDFARERPDNLRRYINQYLTDN